MKLEALAIADVKLVKPSVFADSRGFFAETYNKRALSAAGIEMEFVQDNHSLSTSRCTIRGLHFQTPPRAQDKLVRVVRGAIFDVAVDIRRGSSTFGRHVSVILSAENKLQIFVPKGFAHGFCTLVPETEVIYKVSDYYVPECDRGIHWADRELAIEWPLSECEPVLSGKDRCHPTLRDSPDYFSA